MKKTLFLGIIAAAAMAIVSCDEVKDAINEFEDDQPAKVEESNGGLTLVFSCKQNGVGMYITTNFEVPGTVTLNVPDTICSYCNLKTTYPLETAAQAAYDSKVDGLTEQQIKDLNVKLDGKVLTFNQPEFVGQSKPIVKTALFATVKAFERGSQAANQQVQTAAAQAN